MALEPRKRPAIIEVGTLGSEPRAVSTYSPVQLSFPFSHRGLFRERVKHAPVAITVAIVDDDFETVASLIPELQAAGPKWEFRSFSSTNLSLEAILSARPAAILMEVGGPHLDGIKHTRRLKATVPHIPVIMLSGRLDAVSVFLSVLAGASGYISKPASSSIVIAAISDAIHGLSTFCAQAQTQLASFIRVRSSTAANLLTQREMQVVGCLFQDLSEKEIAKQLGIEYSTLHAHLESIYRKLRAHNRQGALGKFLGRDRNPK